MMQKQMRAGDERPPWTPIFRAQTELGDHRKSRRRAGARGVSRASENPRLTIVVAEDEPSIGYLVADILEAAGYHVELAPDGRAALALANRESPALVLTDRMMPDFGGIDLVRRLRANPATRSLPVALMSATRPSLGQMPTSHGATDTLAKTQCIEIDGELVPFLPKPFELDELVDLVDALAHEPDQRHSAERASSH